MLLIPVTRAVPTSGARYTTCFAVACDGKGKSMVIRVSEPFPSIEQIAVLRGGGLGDLLFALPAVEALAAAYPDARLTLLGMPLHRELLAGRLHAGLDVEELP